MSGYYYLYIRGKKALVVPTGRRVNKAHKLQFEFCNAKPSIEMLAVVVKMAQDGILEVYEESSTDIKIRKAHAALCDLENMKDVTRQIRCKTCGHVFLSKDNELKADAVKVMYPNIGEFKRHLIYFATCPTCKEKVYVKEVYTND